MNTLYNISLAFNNLTNREEFEDDESNLDDIALLASILLVDSEIYNTAAVFLLSITRFCFVYYYNLYS